MMKANKFFVALSLCLCGCATTTPPPLAYLALEKPKGIIQSVKHQEMNKTFSRGGWYVGNYNFRPAADIQSYIEQAQKEANTTVLRNVDVQLNIPVAFDILFFGYNHASDSVMLKAETAK